MNRTCHASSYSHSWFIDGSRSHVISGIISQVMLGCTYTTAPNLLKRFLGLLEGMRFVSTFGCFETCRSHRKIDCVFRKRQYKPLVPPRGILAGKATNLIQNIFKKIGTQSNVVHLHKFLHHKMLWG